MIKRFKCINNYYNLMAVEKLMYFYELGLLREGLVCESGRASGIYSGEDYEYAKI